ncbi:carboxypeptidase-like regulatory domain-containing protein [Engelhardtia mirabilis]|uniref:Uncharacterized protein n=1 Tax=Engelhardtia mirabilis TaxID=2528011 RepID=A0A518BFC4_9BACT|nr:hypothetical protein Pla133_07310 [Planctomycetes bacterium Pla133]QDU99991.1 hypothetical protein Pla86_07300 [Planctomycetes bacterium Pla86]
MGSRPLGVVAAILAVSLAVFLVGAPRGGEGRAADPTVVDTPRSEMEPASLTQAPNPGTDPATRRELTESDRSESDVAQSSEGRGAGAVAREPTGRSCVLVRLLDRASRPHMIESVEVEAFAIAVHPARPIARATGTDTQDLTFDYLPLGEYEFRTTAPGYRSLPFTAAIEADPDGAGPPAAIDVYLWPSNELPVVVRTLHGQSLAGFAAALGCAPHQLWSGVFDIRLSLDGAARDDSLGHFEPAPGHKRWNYFGDAIGTLVLERDPPLWAELLCSGEVVAERPVSAGDEALRFDLDEGAATATFARLTLQAVDCFDGGPIEGADVTLEAEGSTYRRGEHQGLATGPDGRVVLERIVPSRYELTVETEAGLHQRWIDFASGQDVDLGPIELGCGGEPLTIRVVGGPPEWSHAFVELAPFDDTKPLQDVYPGNLHRGIGPGEDYLLPMPEQRSILRVQIPGGIGSQRPLALGGQVSAMGPSMSRSVVIDPALRPVGAIELTLEPVVDVDLLLAVDGIGEVRILDENGLWLGRAQCRGPRNGVDRWNIDVTRGTYTLVALDGSGAERLRRRATFDGQGPIELP